MVLVKSPSFMMFAEYIVVLTEGLFVFSLGFHGNMGIDVSYHLKERGRPDMR